MLVFWLQSSTSMCLCVYEVFVSIVPPTIIHPTHAVSSYTVRCWLMCGIYLPTPFSEGGTAAGHSARILDFCRPHQSCSHVLQHIRKEERRRRSAPDVNGTLRTAAKIQRQAEHDQQQSEVINYSTPHSTGDIISTSLQITCRKAQPNSWDSCRNCWSVAEKIAMLSDRGGQHSGTRRRHVM